MKKKLIALLLASSMVLTGFASVYGAEDFTDPGDGAAMESVTENEWDEDCFSDTEDGDFTSEESGDALFSDEKEIPAVQNGEVWIENAGQGMTAGTSVYNSKSSFGRRKTFPQLADMGNSPGSYSLNWANPEYTSYYTDTAGNLHIVAWKNQILYDVSCNPDLNITSVTKVKLQLPLWGGFYAAPDGNFYVVTGQKNLDENDSLTVVRVLKYDCAWKLLGATDISGDYTNMFKGIYIPFDGASLRMTQIGSTLIVHTGREMYGMDGIHHQSDVTFVINTQDMTLISYDMPVIAVVDPDMMSSMPKGLTASTGMDALTHAIEGYTTKAAWEMTDMFHIKAIEIIGKSLRSAVANEKEGREGMALGQYIAGMGFSNVGLGIAHSMAHTLGAVYDTPHGVACAMMLPIVMEYNADCTGEKYREIARALGVKGVDDMSVEEYRKAAVDAVQKLSVDVGIPTKLEALKEEDLQFLAESAHADACAPGNPKDASVEDLKELFRKLM